MAETKTYTGGCHCGEVRFEVTADLGSVVSCNCSICQKRGALWTFVPPEQFALRAGADDVKDYQFGKKTIHHFFCPQCGVGWHWSVGDNPGIRRFTFQMFRDQREVIVLNPDRDCFGNVNVIEFLGRFRALL